MGASSYVGLANAIGRPDYPITLECATVAEYAEANSENYEGWTNYETRCVNLWLNKETSYQLNKSG